MKLLGFFPTTKKEVKKEEKKEEKAVGKATEKIVHPKLADGGKVKGHKTKIIGNKATKAEAEELASKHEGAKITPTKKGRFIVTV